MIRHVVPQIAGLAFPLALHARQPEVSTANRIPLIHSVSSGFLMSKARMNGEEVNLVVDSGGQLETEMMKQWVLDQKKKPNPLGNGESIGDNADVFTTRFDGARIGDGIKLLNPEAKVIVRQFQHHRDHHSSSLLKPIP